MELKELAENICIQFEIETIIDLPEKIKIIIENNCTEYYKKFCDLVDDLSVDWLQMIFQYYMADRKEKMQHYTPKSLARLVGILSACDGEKTCLDMCAGSGALTIQKWSINKNVRFICQEFDINVIYILMFNLAARNIDAVVMHCDVLQNDVFNVWRIEKGKNYSKISTAIEGNISADSCISNPPYNMKWTNPIFAQLQPRFCECELPPESNANYAFILSAITVADKAILIMPTAALTTENRQEKSIVKHLVETNLIEAVIMCPDGMFESTSIPVCVIVLNRKKESALIEMIDMKNSFKTIIREQNGQFGGKSHTARTYMKEVKIFEEEDINKATDALNRQKTIENFCKPVTIQEVAQKDYCLSPIRYIDNKMDDRKFRELSHILNDLNNIIKEKNVCKLTINETIAKAIGFDTESMKKTSSDDIALNDLLQKVAGGKIEKYDYIAFSKNKNEVKFENNSKTTLSSIFMLIFQTWKQHLYYLNQEENRYLAELRDALLPKLMSGEICTTHELSDRPDQPHS